MRSNALKCAEKASSNSKIEPKSVFRLSMIFCGISGLFGGLRSFVFFNILISAVCAFKSADICALTWCGCNSLPLVVGFFAVVFLPLAVAFLGVAFLAVVFFPLAMIILLEVSHYAKPHNLGFTHSYKRVFNK